MVQLQGSLLALTTPRYRQSDKRDLGVLSKFLLIFLIYWEYQRRSKPSLAGIKTLQQLYNLTGLNQANAMSAIQELEEHHLFRWAHGEYMLAEEGLTKLTRRYYDPTDIDARKWCVAESLCQYFFSPATRKRTVGRMNYLDKFLMMSLAVTADEEGQIKGADFAIWGHWFEMDQMRLADHLKKLKTANGFVLDFSQGYRLGEGLHNPSAWVTLNPAHPWLHGDPSRAWQRGNLDFYGYCLMEGRVMHIQGNYADKEKTIAICENDEFGFVGFERHMDYEPFWQSLRDYITALEARQQHEAKQKAEAAAQEVDNQPNDPHSPEKGKDSKNSAIKPIPATVEVLPQWGSSIEQLKKRDAEYKRQIHRICFDLAQEVLRSISLSIKTLTRDAQMKALACHPLFIDRGFGEATERPTINKAMTQEMYLWMLYQGTGYMLDTIVKVIVAALKAHPDKAVVDGKCEARLIHFEVPARESRLRKRRYSQEYCLSGVLFMRVLNTRYQSIFVQQTPALRDDLQLTPEGSWFINPKGCYASIGPYYENCLAAGYALIRELQGITPSEAKRGRKSQEMLDETLPKSWLEFLQQRSTRQSRL